MIDDGYIDYINDVRISLRRIVSLTQQQQVSSAALVTTKSLMTDNGERAVDNATSSMQTSIQENDQTHLVMTQCLFNSVLGICVCCKECPL